MTATMKLTTKKRFSYFVIGLLFFLGGVEYAVILPTAWFYLQHRFGAPSYLLGVLISAFSFSGLFAGPLMGRWSDKVGKTRTIFLLANLFEIAGNVMYFFGLSSWFLVAGRFVAGIGAGVGAPVIADIARVTTSEERTAVMSLFMAVRQFGLIIGPGFNLFLREINFTVGSVIVDKYSAPGAFMAILWTILEILVLLMYWDLPTLHRAIVRQTMDYTYRQDSESQFLPPPTPNPSIIPPIETQDTTDDARSIEDSDGILVAPDRARRQTPPEALPKPKPRRYPSLDRQFTSSSEMIESAERFMVAGSPDSGPIMFSATPQDDLSPIATRRSPDEAALANGINSYGTNAYSTPSDRPPSRLRRVIDDDSYIQQQPQQDGEILTSSERRRSTSSLDLSWSYYYEEYMREEVIAILAVVFIAFFNQTAMEAMITPLTDTLLDWDEFEVSLLYCGAGVEIILVFFLITYLSRHLHDRVLLLIGYLIVTLTIAALLGYLPNAPQHQMLHNLPFFISGVVLDVFGLPFLVVTSTSLYSKVTREETQGFSQGLRGVCGGIGTLLGPLWADSLITHLYLMLGVMLGLMLIALVMLLLSFKYMKERGKMISTSSNHSVNAEYDNEREPLIRNANQQ